MGTIVLDNGRFLIRDYGKYGSGLCFICDTDTVSYENADREEFNFEYGNLSKVRGRFFISKKCTNCFDVCEDGPHVLVRDHWGGAFDSYRGGEIFHDDALYKKRSSSNGGGIGIDYAVFPAEWKNVISIDDI